jgi:hypothetical protein
LEAYNFNFQKIIRRENLFRKMFVFKIIVEGKNCFSGNIFGPLVFCGKRKRAINSYLFTKLNHVKLNMIFLRFLNPFSKFFRTV